MLDLTNDTLSKAEEAQRERPHLEAAHPTREGLEEGVHAEDGEMVEGGHGLSSREDGQRFEICIVGGEERREICIFKQYIMRVEDHFNKMNSEHLMMSPTKWRVD